MRAALSFEQAPPFSVPMRFLLSAPLFAAAAGLLVTIRAEEMIATRWSAAALAATHLLTVGFMLLAMSGALLQFMPVAAGANVWRPRLVGGLTHAGVSLGALLLAGGFLAEAPAAMRAAAVLLGATLALFVIVIALGLARSPAIGPTIQALRIAAGGLAVTVALGVTLASAFGWALPLPLLELTAAHAAWGLLGWALMLVAGVAYLVVPMFQLTPPYPLRAAYAMPLVLLAALLVWSVALALDAAAGRWGASALACVAVVGFALLTLRLQRRRKRRVADATLLFWRVAMVSLALAPPVWLAGQGAFAALPAGRLDWLLGVLVLVGVFVAVINGMVYKIVPFLSWLHLQRVLPLPPTMHEMLGERAMRGQFRAYLGALALLAGGALWPPLASAGGALLTLSCLWLAWNLLGAARKYARTHAAALSNRAAA